jgi:hypothetical protein
MNNIKINSKTNLIGEPVHKRFLEIQTIYGFAQRGGIAIPLNAQAERIISDVNILNSQEVKNLIIFSETIFNN